jgi:hypothetical protein
MGCPKALSSPKGPHRVARFERREPSGCPAENRQYSIARLGPNFDPPVPPMWVVVENDGCRLFDDPKRVTMSRLQVRQFRTFTIGDAFVPRFEMEIIPHWPAPMPPQQFKELSTPIEGFH